MHEQQLPREVTEAIERECNAVDLAAVFRDDPPKKEHPWRTWRGEKMPLDDGVENE